MSSTSRTHVDGGYCIRNNGGIGSSFCALEFGQCRPEDQDFRSSRETEFAGAFRTCLSQREVDTIYLGQCRYDHPSTSSSITVCVPDKESCEAMNNVDNVDSNSTFIPASGMEINSACEVGQAVFGKCEDRCVWSIDACEQNEIYTLPLSSTTASSPPEEDVCTCDKVQVGGCKYPGVNIFCAVSPDSCDSQQTWLSPKQVEEQENRSCYLCRPPPTPPTPTVSSNNSPSATTISTNKQSSNNNMLFVGGITGGVVGGLVLAVITITIYRKRAFAKSFKAQQQENSPPPQIIF